MRQQLYRVMDLREKGKLAIKYGLARNRVDLAAKLRPVAEGDGKPLSPKTFDWWVSGGGTRDPEQMPGDAFDNFVALFMRRLELPASVVRELMAQPAEDLENALLAKAGPSLETIIARDAKKAGFVVLRDEELSLSREYETQTHELPKVPMGGGYRIAFPALHQHPYAVVLQNAGHAWGALRSQMDKDRKSLLVPGMKEDGALRYLVEREQDGVHRFIAFQGKHPFPASLADYRSLPITLDRQALQLLAAHYESLPQSERACQLLEVEFQNAGTGR